MTRQTPDERASPTETVDPRHAELDAWPAATALAAMWEGQMAAIAALGPALDALAGAAEAAAARLSGGDGRLVYAGAGTSIRLAVQDGTELTPTFDWPEERCAYLVAGGPSALTRSIEGAEDDRAAAAAQLAAIDPGPGDVVIGVAASGRTPFTLAAVEAAREAGALTIAIANNANTPLLDRARHPVLVATGAEPVAGSTRMKAGTAQKAALNLFSTQVMIGLGRVYKGLMVDMRPGNAKLRGRAAATVARLAGCDTGAAGAALAAADWRIKPAVLVALGEAPGAARERLAATGGNLRAALAGRGA